MTWTVLLVDDSRTIHEVVRMSLINTDFRLITAFNAEEGFEIAKEEQPSVILADVRMPGMDGYELCALLKEEPMTRTIPVLLLNGVNIPQDIQRSKDVKAMGFFPKPFDTQDLLDQVTMLCQASSPNVVPDSRTVELSEDVSLPEEMSLPKEPEEDIFEEASEAEAEEWAELDAEGLISTNEVAEEARLETGSDFAEPSPQFDEFAATSFEDTSFAKPRTEPAVEPNAIEELEIETTSFDTLEETQDEEDIEVEFYEETATSEDMYPDSDATVEPIEEAIEEISDEPIKISDEEAEFLLEEIDEEEVSDFDNMGVEVAEESAAIDEFGFVSDEEPMLEDTVEVEEEIEEITADEQAEEVVAEEMIEDTTVYQMEETTELADEVEFVETQPETTQESELAETPLAAMSDELAEDEFLRDDVSTDESLEEEIELEALEMDEAELEELDIEEDVEFEEISAEVDEDYLEPLEDESLMEEIESDYLPEDVADEAEIQDEPQISDDAPLFEEIATEPQAEEELFEEAPLLMDELEDIQETQPAEETDIEDDTPLIEEVSLDEAPAQMLSMEEDTSSAIESVVVKPEDIEESDVKSLLDIAPVIESDKTEETVVAAEDLKTTGEFVSEVFEEISTEEPAEEPEALVTEQYDEDLFEESDAEELTEEIIEEVAEPAQDDTISLMEETEKLEDELEDELEEADEIELPQTQDSDEILLLFRRAIREEMANVKVASAPATFGGEFELQLREMVRQEVKAALAEKELESLGESEKGGIDPVELKLLVKEAIKEEMAQVFDEGDDAVDFKAEILEGVKEEFNKLQPSEPAKEPPTPQEIAAAILGELKAPLEEIRTTMKKLETLDQLGGQINTWINSALSEFPDAEEVKSIVKNALSGNGEPISMGQTSTEVNFDESLMRTAMREELGKVMGKGVEAVVWEVVPDLAEQIIKKELDRLTADKAQ